MKHLRYLLMATLVALPLTACDEDDDPPVVDIPVTGTISGAVSVEGSGVAGVSVTLVGATSQSATTDAGGAYSFANVEAGSYGVAISDFPADVSFSNVSKTTSITTAGQTATVDFSGSYIRTATITGNVSADGGGLAAVAVSLTGPEGASNAVTDAAGNYSVSGLRAGDYTVAIEVPAGYIFANSSFDVTVGVGQAQSVSFVGEAEVTVDPVTASVVITSLTSNTGVILNPNNLAGQVNITLNIDPGENDLQRVCVLLDGAEVANGCQTLGSAVAEGEMQQGVLQIVFSIFTNDFDAISGLPVYLNNIYELSAVLDLENAQQSNVTTSMQLTFNNTDEILTYLTSEFAEVGGGAQWVGGLQTVEILPTLFSGKTLEELDVEFFFDGPGDWDYTIDGPFPTTVVFDPSDEGWAFTTDDDLESFFEAENGLYSDGSVGTFNDLALVNGSSEMYTNFDFEAPTWAGNLFLPEQAPAGDILGEAEEQCCSNNWAGPGYMPDDGLAATPADAGIGVDFYQFTVENVATEEISIIPSDGTMADAMLAQSLTNDEFELCAEAVDFFGNSSSICKTTEQSNTGSLFGYDDTGAGTQTVTLGPPTQVIYNLADGVADVDLGDLVVAGSEDRSGFSGVPFRGYIEWWDADDNDFIMAQDIDDGGAVNMPSTILSCEADGNATPSTGVALCYPDYNSADGVYYVTGELNNQGGVLFGTAFEGWVYNDQTIPVITDNVSVPFNITVGDPMTFSGPVADNLHLGTTAFGFNLPVGGATDLYVPLGGNIANQAGDTDPWDMMFPTDEIATTTIDPAIVGVQLYSGGAAIKFNAVRAQHTDLAGNVSAQQSNNILDSSVGAPTDFTTGAGAIEAWGLTTDAPAGPNGLCNGQGATACGVDDETSVELTIVAEGPTGTFANPFLTGDVYVYLRVDAGANGTIDDGEDIFLIDVLDAAAAVITDEGVGGSRFYTWTVDVTSAQVAAFAANATDYFLHVMGVKHSTGTALLDDTGVALIIVDGS